ncbi:MAG TPA: hypothetical protein VKT31_07110, partial [Solirubrobacteraceae bacterium]|nr:hypothetical protein [Solirubrobacteraceae bacterium]
IDYYTDLVAQGGLEATGPGQKEAYDRIDAELPNIRLAVMNSLSRGDPSALSLSAALGQYGFVRNRLPEVAHWCIDAAAIPHAPTSLRAQALQQAGFALVLMGAPDGGHALIDDALELARFAGDRRRLTEALLMAADLRLETGLDAEARPMADEALEIAQAIGDELLIGQALVMAARAARARVSRDEVARDLNQALAIFERAGDRRQEGRVIVNRVFLWLEAGDLDAAEKDAARLEALGEELDHAIGKAVARVVQVFIAIERGQLDRASELLDSSLAIARECGYQALLAWCLAAEAVLSAGLGDDRRAATVLGAIDGAGGALGGERWVRLRLEALRGELGARLGSELASLLADGERLRLEDLAAERV